MVERMATGNQLREWPREDRAEVPEPNWPPPQHDPKPSLRFKVHIKVQETHSSNFCRFKKFHRGRGLVIGNRRCLQSFRCDHWTEGDSCHIFIRGWSWALAGAQVVHFICSHHLGVVFGGVQYWVFPYAYSIRKR